MHNNNNNDNNTNNDNDNMASSKIGYSCFKLIKHRENKTCLFENFRSYVDLHQSSNVRTNTIQSNATKYESYLLFMKESGILTIK